MWVCPHPLLGHWALLTVDHPPRYVSAQWCNVLTSQCVVLTCLATTGQRAAGQGFLGSEVSLSKALWNKSAEKQKPRHRGQQHRCTEVGGTGCHFGVHPSWRRDTFEEVRQDGRGCLAIGKEAQGGQVPLSGSHERAPFGCHCWGSWWTVVRQTQAFLQSLAHCKAQGRTGCSLAIGGVGQPLCGGPMTFGAGGVGRRAGVRCERLQLYQMKEIALACNTATPNLIHLAKVFGNQCPHNSFFPKRKEASHAGRKACKVSGIERTDDTSLRVAVSKE